MPLLAAVASSWPQHFKTAPPHPVGPRISIELLTANEGEFGNIAEHCLSSPSGQDPSIRTGGLLGQFSSRPTNYWLKPFKQPTVEQDMVKCL
jgi:hypothetical protein